MLQVTVWKDSSSKGEKGCLQDPCKAITTEVMHGSKKKIEMKI